MIRRHLYEEVRVTWLAPLARRIAIFSLPVTLIAIVLHRIGLVEYELAYITLATGLAVALLGLLVAVAAFVVIWNEGLRGLGSAAVAFLIGTAVLAWPTFEFMRAVNLPEIVDISTDTSDPPRFVAVASARSSSANPIAYPGEQTAALQQMFYPAVKPHEIDASPDEVFNTLLSLVERRGWRVLDSVPPRGGQREGRIEAVAQTFLMGFREDIVIRVRALQNAVRVDIRSASRYGTHDFGSNARRIESLLSDFTEARRRR